MMQFDQLSHPNAGAATVQHVYRDATGAPVLIANRYEPKGKGKFFLPYDVARAEWKAPQSRPLYNLDKITSAAAETLVWFVEGEKCADALSKLGLLATTSFGGCNALAKTDLSPLKGRDVVIWPDNDEPGQSYAKRLKSGLEEIGAKSGEILEFTEEDFAEFRGIDGNSPLPVGWDAADAIASGWTSKTVIKRSIPLILMTRI